MDQRVLSGPAKPVRGFLIDSLYFVLAVTLGPPYLLSRRLKGKPLGDLGKRLGFFEQLPKPSGKRVWIHGVSVGEVLAARSLVSELRRAGLEVVISSTTRTGIQTARETYKGVSVIPAPLDFGPSTRAFLRKVAPDAIVLLELELWPRLLMLAEERQIPVVVANARISESSLKGYGRLRRFLPSFPGSVAAFLVQDEVHRGRLLSLGVAPGRVIPCGNLKFDNTVESGGAEARQKLRLEEKLPEDVLLLVAGSTHGTEESLLLETFSILRRRFASLRLWLAPRHPERLPEVAQLLRESGFSFARRSQPRTHPAPDILLIDTMGELGRLYAAADLALVGGTWAPIGGHNLLEPIAQSVPLVVGPHLDTVRAVATELERCGSLRVALNVGELVSACDSWLEDSEALKRAGVSGCNLLKHHRGATKKTVNTILALLSERGKHEEL